MSVLFSNNASAPIAASIIASDTTITVASGQGAEFPSPGIGQWFYATLVDSSNNLEIVKCTSRSSDTLTVVRGQDGTSARTYAAGSLIEVRLVAAALADFQAMIVPYVHPAGAVEFFAQTTPPAGWLKANGSLVLRSAYPGLFSAIGVTYGAGDGSTTFALPELRGEFIRVWDDSRGVDAGRAIGTAQGQGYQSHSHGVSDPGHVHYYSRIESFGGSSYSGGGSGMSWSPTSGEYTGISIAASGGAETRPRNVALMACIKY